MKKTKVTIFDVEGGSTSLLKMKETKKKKKKLKLISKTGWTKPETVRMTLTKNCAFLDEDKVVIENENFLVEVDFNFICDLHYILTHADDVGNNWFGKTKILK